MTIDQIEELVRRLIAAGATVIVVLVAPGTASSVPSGAPVATMSPTTTPTRTPTPRAGPPTSTADTTGASGTDLAEAGRTASDTRPTSASRTTTRPTSSDHTTPSDATMSGRSSTTVDSSPTTTRTAPRSTTTQSSAKQSEASGTTQPTTGGTSTSTSTESPGTTGTAAAPEPAPDIPQGDTGSSPSADTAASAHGWGTPNREDDFTGGLEQWSVYDGPGHGGQGTRSPSAVTVADGVLTITGDASGTTAGMAWNPGQKYGRWEGRVRAPAADPSYNALLLLWPDAENWPVGGELDFMEMTDPERQVTDFFLHYGEDNSQVNGQVRIDATQWHNWAVEWTPEAITAYVDGKQWYRTTDTRTFPPGPMHLCIQLDWFPEGGTPKESTMQVDWVRQYPPADGAGVESASPVRALLRSMFSWG